MSSCFSLQHVASNEPWQMLTAQVEQILVSFGFCPQVYTTAKRLNPFVQAGQLMCSLSRKNLVTVQDEAFFAQPIALQCLRPLRCWRHLHVIHVAFQRPLKILQGDVWIPNNRFSPAHSYSIQALAWCPEQTQDICVPHPCSVIKPELVIWLDYSLWHTFGNWYTRGFKTNQQKFNYCSLRLKAGKR